MGRASRRKEEQRQLRKTGFKRMEMADANEICGPWDRNKAVHTKCPSCEMEVFLHCDLCKIQITGCLHSAVERMSTEDLKRFKAEIEKRRAREAGIVLPGEEG